jgi:hypothetical protein
MYGVVCLNDLQQVLHVGLGIAAGNTAATLDVVARQHASVDGGVRVVYALKVSCQEPCYNECNQRQYYKIPTYFV